MPSVAELQPIFQETVDRIRARVNADANSGIDPADMDFLDTSPGGFWWDIVGAVILEIARLWDSLGSETVAAMFPSFAWGVYLDAHGVTVGLARKIPARAAGVVTFTGTAGTFLATGTQVATQPPSPDSDPHDRACDDRRRRHRGRGYRGGHGRVGRERRGDGGDGAALRDSEHRVSDERSGDHRR
jgi:hypothetical protein